MVAYYDLLEAIEKSNIPILVQAHDWAMLPESFHREIERDYVVVQEGAKQTTAGEWQTCTLGELTDNFDAIRIPVKETDRGVGPYPYYGASGVVDHVDGFLFDGEYLLIAEDGENLRTRTTPIAFLANGKFWVNNHAHIVQGNSNADTRFLKYELSVLDISGYLTGSTMPKLTQGNMNRIPLLTPPLPKQRTIAYVLGTLDDKIELNRRMNETLEAMARALFKSWFVDFEPVRAKMEGRWRRGESLPGLPAGHYDIFPDHLVDSELGEIPEGWGLRAWGDVVEVVGGTTPSTRVIEYWQGGTHCWATPKDLSNLSTPVLLDTERKITDAGLDKIGSGLLPPGTVLLSSRAPIGYLAVSEEPVAINQGFIGIPPSEKVSNLFMLHWCEVFQDEIVNHANGSTFLEISKSNFRRIPLVVPDQAVMTAFDGFARPLHECIVSNERESHDLATQRDTLLPKLVSGEVGVWDTNSDAPKPDLKLRVLPECEE